MYPLASSKYARAAGGSANAGGRLATKPCMLTLNPPAILVAVNVYRYASHRCPPAGCVRRHATAHTASSDAANNTGPAGPSATVTALSGPPSPRGTFQTCSHPRFVPYGDRTYTRSLSATNNSPLGATAKSV